MKIAINVDFGGFGLSKAAFAELGIPWDGYGYLRNEDFDITSDDYNAYRSHPKLIAAIEKIGVEQASGSMAQLRIIDIPDGMEFEIDNYDGMESVHEKHRSWY